MSLRDPRHSQRFITTSSIIRFIMLLHNAPIYQLSLINRLPDLFKHLIFNIWKGLYSIECIYLKTTIRKKHSLFSFGWLIEFTKFNKIITVHIFSATVFAEVHSNLYTRIYKVQWIYSTKLSFVCIVFPMKLDAYQTCRISVTLRNAQCNLICASCFNTCTMTTGTKNRIPIDNAFLWKASLL